MATINAAKALGLDGEIGSLEPGKRADIAVFDIDKPYVGVLHRPISSFICAGKGSDARWCWSMAISSIATGCSRVSQCGQRVICARRSALAAAAR